jgi:glutamate/tyrosine decarboxylase-like PLP-dependent enzyme
VYDVEDLLRATADRAARYLRDLGDRPVYPAFDPDAVYRRLGGPVPDHSEDPAVAVEALADAVEPNLVSVAGGRYFGFVTGGAVPASLAADWLTSVWDQNAFSFVSSPVAAVVEDIAAEWIKELLRLPAEASVAFVTGCQMAHVTCLAAARGDVLGRVGWDINESGLAGAPPIRIVTGEKRHVTVDRALRLLGIGARSLDLVAVDEQGRMAPDVLRDRLGERSVPTIVVAQAGEVNTGSFDPLGGILDTAAEHDAWVHVDGAFGIWARISPELAKKVDRLEEADSWAFDAHKWLNVPYDSGIAVCAHPKAHRTAMLGRADYLPPTPGERDAFDWTPEASRRARAFAVYAAVRSLGRSGVRNLVERCCALARRFADGLAAIPGVEVLNSVELNQVLLRFRTDEDTQRVLEHVQQSGVAWMGETSWEGRPAIRISVSSWVTSETDVDRTMQAFVDAS